MQNPRPRKYASDAERQAAFRSRASMVEFRADEKTAEKLTEIANTLDISRSDLLLSMVKFALTNHQWARFGLTHKTLPRYEENPTMATKKFSPAQIAAQKLFAERARAGTLSPKYNEVAVNKSIASSRSKISASEGKTIHRLLKGRHGNPAAKKPLTLQERSKKFKIELGFDKFKTFKKVVGYYPSDSSPDYELVALFQTQREAVSAGRTYAENYPKFRWFVKDL